METFLKSALINKRYRIKSVIGQGGMGIVYLVNDRLKANLPVALKTIKSGLMNSRNLKIFRKEFDIMTRLKHPNLVKVYNFGYDPCLDCYYITMEFLKGMSLLQIIKSQRKLTYSFTLRVIVEILRGMSFMHSRNIISRDIKPSNIIIQRDNAKLMDFGLSDIEMPDIHNLKGSPFYMAPESLTGAIDRRVDIYSLGIVLYQLLTGTVMLNVPSLSSLFSILSDRTRFRSIADSSLAKIRHDGMKTIIYGMTAFEKEKRYGTCADIILEINRLMKTDFPVETEATRESYVLGVSLTDRKSEIKNVLNYININQDNKRLFIMESKKGLGKSRIFSEVKKYCQLNDIPFLESECYNQITKPYFSITNILRQILLHSPEKLNIAYKRHLKKLLEINVPSSIWRASQTIEKDILIQNISRFLFEYGLNSRTAAVLYLNNLQWADEGSLAVLHETLMKIHRSDQNKLRIFATIRSEDSNLISPFIKKLQTDSLIKLYKLKPFDSNVIKEYINNIFGKEYTDKDIFNNITQIGASTGGSPLFLNELIRLLIRSSIIYKKTNRWNISCKLSDISIPSNLSDLVSRRIKPLLARAEYKNIIETMSLIRIGLSLKEIQQLFNKIPPRRIKNIIIELEKIEILKSERVEQDLRYYFFHDIIQDIAEAGISNIKELHSIIAERFEEIFKTRPDSYAEELAYHYSASDKKEKAIYYLMKAGKLGESRYISNIHILGHYYRALELAIDMTDEIKISEISTQIALILVEEGEFSDSLRMLDKALFLLEKQKGSLKNNIAMINNYKGIVFQRKGAFENSLYYLKLAIDQLSLNPGKCNDELIAQCCNNIGMTYLNYGKFENAMIYFRKSLEMRLILFGPNHVDTMKSYHNIGVTYLRKSDFENALNYLNITKKINESLRIKDHNTAFIWDNLSIIFSSINKKYISKKYMDKALRIRLELLGEDHSHTAFSYINMGVYYIGMSDFKTALQYFKKAGDIHIKKFGMYSPFTAASMNNIGECYFALKEYDNAEYYLKKALKIRKKTLGIPNNETHRSYIQLFNLYKRKKDYKKFSSYGQYLMKIYKKHGTALQQKQISEKIGKS